MAKVKNFRIDVDGKDVALYLSRPTHEEVLAIDMEYRKMYSVAVREGIITTAEAMKQYKEVGAWTKEDEEEVSQIMFDISILSSVIKNETGENDEKKRREAALKTTKLRTELLQKMNTRTGLLEQTAEQMAEEQKIHKYILLCCRKKEDDERYFESREQQQEFANDYREQMSAIYRDAYFFDYDLPDDISESWEEVRYMKEIAEKEAQKQKEAKKKRGRPKKEKAEVK